MNRLFFIMFFLLTTNIYFLISPAVVQALTPSRYVIDCNKNPKAHGDCGKILCEWENISRNWPNDTGYREDCNTRTYSLINNDTVLLGGIAGAGIVIGLAVFVARKSKKKAY